MYPIDNLTNGPLRRTNILLGVNIKLFSLMPFLKFFILELESCREGFSSDAADSKMKNDPKFFFYIDKLEIRF